MYKDRRDKMRGRSNFGDSEVTFFGTFQFSKRRLPGEVRRDAPKIGRLAIVGFGRAVSNLEVGAAKPRFRNAARSSTLPDGAVFTQGTGYATSAR
jgi:hypothetical protein